MKKIGFIFSNLSILLGVITLIITSILNEVMPKLGYLVFQASTGSYSESSYKMNFYLVNFVAIVLILVGIIVSIRMYLLSNDK